MGTVLTIITSAYYFIQFHRITLLYFLFIFLIPFLPRYIGLGVGEEGFSLSLIRILLMILFISFVISFTQNKGYILNRILLVYQKNKILINTLLLLFLLKIISLLLNSNTFPLYIILFNDFLFSIFIFFLTVVIIDSEESIARLVKILFYSYTIVLVLVIIEYIVKYPLLSIFASDQMTLLEDVSQGYVKDDGRYRVSAGFDNPIPLGEYLTILFPLIISYINKNKYSLGLMLIYSLLFIFAVYATGSRAAILMSAIMVYLYVMFKLYKSNQTVRIIMYIFNFIIAGFAVYFTYTFISGLISGFSGSFLAYSSSEERSSVSRALQYIAIYTKTIEAPLLGFGRVRNASVEFQLGAIDNYYFIVILEVGIIGLFTYLTFNYLLIKIALQQYISGFSNYYLFPILISIVLMILYQILVSVPDVYIFLYIFAALISIMKTIQYNKGEVN